MASFHILFTHPRTRRKYKALVTIIFQTDKVITFRISAGDKSFEMKKYLYRKNNKWQTGILNFNPSQHSKDTKQMITDIRKAIDDWLMNNTVN